MKLIELVTGRAKGPDRFFQEEKLEKVAKDAMKRHVGVTVDVTYKNNLHDRRISFVLL